MGMDQLDMMGLLLQNPGLQRSPAAEDTNPMASPITQMMYPPVENPFSPLGLMSVTKTTKKGSGAEPLSQADYLQKQLQAMNVQGLAQQQEGIKAYEKQLQDLTKSQAPNPWAVVASGLSDFYNGSKNLDKLAAQQQQQKQLALLGTEKVQKAKNDISENQRNLIKDQLDYEKAREKNATDEERTRQMFGLAKAKFDKKDFTPGQEAADKKFADEYQQWNQQGGYATVNEHLKALEEAATKLEADPTLTGGSLEKFVPGGSSDAARARVKPESFALQQQVSKAIGASLRQTLGAAFAKEEGERIMAQTFDPRLPGTENAKRILAEARKIRAQALQKDAASKYFEQNGTLVGQGAAQSRPTTSGGLSADQEKRRQELLKKASGGR